jgi:hypothetical protein
MTLIIPHLAGIYVSDQTWRYARSHVLVRAVGGEDGCSGVGVSNVL